jgi:hypothetical protein
MQQLARAAHVRRNGGVAAPPRACGAREKQREGMLLLVFEMGLGQGCSGARHRCFVVGVFVYVYTYTCIHLHRSMHVRSSCNLLAGRKSCSLGMVCIYVYIHIYMHV